MPIAEFRLFINNSAADPEMLDRFSEIQVDQAIGMAAEAELKMDLAADANGEWNDAANELAEPMQRVRVEVKVGRGEFIPLIDGPVVQQRFDFSAVPDRSSLTVVVQDDSVLLNQEEAVAVFEDQTADEIAATLMEAAGLDVEADAVPDAGSSLERFTVQRGTAMKLLRTLAKRYGMFVYVKPGDEPGKSVGVFAKPDLEPAEIPELLLMGADRNINHITVEFDALRPMAASAESVRVSDVSVLTAQGDTADLTPLGDSPVHSLLTPATVLLARTREEQSDLDLAVQATVNLSSWAFTARGEVNADSYSGVLQPHKVVRVSGAGSRLSGDYLISRVKHVLDYEKYRQTFTLLRNARLEGSASSALGAGVF